MIGGGVVRPVNDDTDALLAKIDNIVGRAEDETDDEHAARVLMIERDHRAREIRKAARA